MLDWILYGHQEKKNDEKNILFFIYKLVELMLYGYTLIVYTYSDHLFETKIK